jgi:hypothetical protein
MHDNIMPNPIDVKTTTRRNRSTKYVKNIIDN